MRALEWLLLASVMAACFSLPSYQDSGPEQPLIGKSRVTRATYRRPPSFLFLLGQFFGQTISDTGAAARNISKIFNDQFTTTTPSPDAVTEEGTNSTETPPKPITRDTLFRILGNNFRGLQRLFNTEWQAAVDQSSTNVANFRKELREAVRPFLLPNRNLTNNQT
ncbi:uncharacterized protein LOC128989767 isoform X2 [Macrosteles quadrilineatus]|uniref:uncharacterized protein LOC128989767 isoform X2 n=1 Tax=Macrosteles quadrilineatus TaxID=74068 RepID=UPI0023E190AD|nr:uncharacterized protein LOC128989767 isoform X2 [Macrosteles quadrilineatus]